jgi:hypothetical protein
MKKQLINALFAEGAPNQWENLPVGTYVVYPGTVARVLDNLLKHLQESVHNSKQRGNRVKGAGELRNTCKRVATITCKGATIGK